MLADSVRKPLNRLKSITAVLPVAISTIMVSPTARPKPIMTAEKIPLIAVGTTTRTVVCQVVAPAVAILMWPSRVLNTPVGMLVG